MQKITIVHNDGAQDTYVVEQATLSAIAALDLRDEITATPADQLDLVSAFVGKLPTGEKAEAVVFFGARRVGVCLGGDSVWGDLQGQDGQTLTICLD